MSNRSLLYSHRMVHLGSRRSVSPWVGLWRLLKALFFTPQALLLNTLVLLASRAGILGGAYPFGMALFFMILRSGSRVRTCAAGISLLIGLASVVQPSRVFVTAISLAIIYAYQAGKKPADDPMAWPGAFGLAGSLATGRILQSWITGLSGADLTSIALEAIMVVLVAVLLAPLARVLREGLPQRLHKEQLVSVGLAAVVVGVGLGGISIGPVHLAEVWNRWVILIAALLGSGAIGAAQGTALGLMAEISTQSALGVGGGAGLYGVSGLLGGLFSGRGKLGVAAGFMLGTLVASVQATTGEEVVLGFLHTAIAVSLFALTPGWITRRLERAIPGTPAEAELAAGREERLRAAASKRLEQVSNVFGELAEIFAGVCPEQGLGEHSEIVPRQLAGVGEIISNLATQIRVDTGKADELEVRVAEELARRRIKYSALKVLHAGGDHPEVTLCYEGNCDGNGRCARILGQAVTAALVETYTPWQVDCTVGRGCQVSLLPERPYDVIVRAATHAKDEGAVSGDSCAKVELSDGKMAVLLSDGMGSGPRAAMESSATVAMLQKLISAGFDRKFAVQTVNSVLLLRSPEETYATLDLAVIDLFTGELEFLKIGSVPSFIRRGKDVEIVKSSSLPIGILSHIDFPVRNRLLHPDDMLVMATDGVLDSLPDRFDKEEWFARILRRSASDEAGDLAENLLDRAWSSSSQANDDMTVVVAKLVKRTTQSACLWGDDLPTFKRRAADQSDYNSRNHQLTRQ